MMDPLTLDRVRLATSRANSRLSAAFKRASAAYADATPDARKSQHECRACFYLDAGRLSGRAFTTYVCAGCHQEDRYPNTGVPVLCASCAETYELCRRCCADVEYRDREGTEVK